MTSCPKCTHCFYPTPELGSAAGDALRELVELKRMKDADGATPEYERRKQLAWEVAFKVCGVIGAPKP